MPKPSPMAMGFDSPPAKVHRQPEASLAWRLGNQRDEA
jgi:hypothetical protein